ncbi:Fc.00g053760.m01.CDS01 [Cosmosporella sp. VM-42]
MNETEGSKCPFCAFVVGRDSEGEYALLLHIETHHPDGQSPFVISEEPALCPQEGCGEVLPQDEMAYHIELHELEADDTPAPPVEEHQHVSSHPASGSSAVAPAELTPAQRRRLQGGGAIQSAWRELFESHTSRHTREPKQRTRHKRKKHFDSEQASSSVLPENQAQDQARIQSSRQIEEKRRQIARLGRSELGKYAHEKQMPDWLVSLLNDQGQIINEGGFCGYRNIQMLTSHIIGAKSAGAEHFGPIFPSIFQVQDLIENAWDMGFNAQGRVETGGVKGTRKYIGTPEAQAVFCSLQIPNSVQAFKDKERGKAKNLLLHAIEQYFQGGIEDVEARIHLTKLPPIYFQHPGHSLTIVGIEKQMDGKVNLLVFDPTFRDSGKMRHLVGKIFQHKPASADVTLEPYRRGGNYLRKYTEFEVL